MYYYDREKNENTDIIEYEYFDTTFQDNNNKENNDNQIYHDSNQYKVFFVEICLNTYFYVFCRKIRLCSTIFVIK